MIKSKNRKILIIIIVITLVILLLGGTFAGDAFAVRPCVYLKTNVKITSGNGTSEQPYLLKYNQ